MTFKNMAIEQYNKNEAQAMITAAYPAMRAFAPIHFMLGGFPTNVMFEQELARYADIMGEVGPSRSWLMESATFSSVEAWAIDAVRKQVLDLIGVFPLVCPFGPITMWRGIEQIANGRKLRIMDISAGCAYLDAYLLGYGHNVIVTDVTQALYLWQNRLLNLWDLAETAFDTLDYPLFRQAQATHIPWWHFARMFENPVPPDVDLIVCDAMIGEANAWASTYILKLAARIFAASNSDLKMFLYRNIGEPRVMSEGHMHEIANSIGLRMHHVGEDAPPIGGPAKYGLSDMAPIQWEHVLPSYRFMDFLGIGR
jgi:hypothetical protein